MFLFRKIGRLMLSAAVGLAARQITELFCRAFPGSGKSAARAAEGGQSRVLRTVVFGVLTVLLNGAVSGCVQREAAFSRFAPASGRRRGKSLGCGKTCGK